MYTGNGEGRTGRWERQEDRLVWAGKRARQDMTCSLIGQGRAAEIGQDFFYSLRKETVRAWHTAKTAIRDWSNDVQLSTIAIYQQLEADH